MNREFWVDGFNLFYYWESTKGFLRTDSDMDIVRAINRSIHMLSKHLGSKCGHTVVYLDGGLSRHETRAAGLRIRYCGPGRKADDRMLGDLGDLGDYAHLVTAISNDRELKGGLKAYGASCLGVGEFLALIQGKKDRGGQGKGRGKAKKGSGPALSKGAEAEILRQKCRSLSESEVAAWLEFFGGDEEAEAEE